jgi:hypothetical protein
MNINKGRANNTPKRYLMMLAMVYLSCSEPKDQELGDPIINPSFSFLQDVNKLYFSVNVESTFQGETLDSVLVFWHGISREGSPDKFNMNDGGVQGDIIMNDDVFAIKILNDKDHLNNDLTDVTGLVFMDYSAVFGSEVFTLRDSVLIGNIIPRIESVVADTFIQRPTDATVSLHLIKAEVFDADGLETIKWAGFTSFHVEGDSLMNNGNPIYLHDDGSEIILYEPNITSGDSIRGDGLFSFRIPVYGTGFEDPNFHTKAGTFKWRFLAQDKSNDYSNMVEHEIVIQ